MKPAAMGLALAVLLAGATARAAAPSASVIDPSPQGSTDAQELVTFGNATYFLGNAPDGWGLWRTDGTLVGTSFVKALSSTAPARARIGLVPNGFAIVTATASAADVFTSDGTAAGTVSIGALPPIDANPNASLDLLGTSAARSYFMRGNALVITDGTAAGTTTVPNLALASAAVSGDHLWRRDGGYRVKRVAPDGTIEAFHDEPSTGGELRACGSKVYFTHGSFAGDRRLFAVDGGTAVPVLTLGNEALPWLEGCVGEKLVFNRRTDAEGCEPWISDGTEAGTKLLKDIRPGAGASSTCGTLTRVRPTPTVFAASDNVAVFAAREADDTTWSVWGTDGTEAGTRKLSSVDASLLRRVGSIGNRLYLRGGMSPDSIFWVDGKNTGTIALGAIPGGTNGEPPPVLPSATLGTKAISIANGEGGLELWVLDDADALAVPSGTGGGTSGASGTASTDDAAAGGKAGTKKARSDSDDSEAGFASGGCSATSARGTSTCGATFLALAVATVARRRRRHDTSSAP